MYTAINKIGDQTPRHTEKTDSRRELERHDPNQQGRNKNKHAADKDEDENLTTLSVEALKTFLDTLIESRTQRPLTGETKTLEPQDYKIQQELNLDTPAQNAPRPHSAQAARAASLYKAASSAIKYNSLLKTTDMASSGPEINLNAADLLTIHHIRDDLKTLSHHNVKHLHISQSENFLNSLSLAIETAKATLKQ